MEVQAAVSGAARSKTMWFGALLIALPQVWDVLAPVFTPLIGEPNVGTVSTVIGALVMVLRVFTTKPLHEKSPNA